MEYLDCPEIWVPVKLDDKYEASNKGRVRRKRDHKILNMSCHDARGYKNVHLSGKTYYLHRVIATSFWDFNPEGYDVNHIDGNKTNNDIRNLEFCTRKENIQHAFRTGLINRTKKTHKKNDFLPNYRSLAKHV